MARGILVSKYPAFSASGSKTQPIYINENGEISTCDKYDQASVKHAFEAEKLVYDNGSEFVPYNVGDEHNPTYFRDGVPVQCGDLSSKYALCNPTSNDKYYVVGVTLNEGDDNRHNVQKELFYNKSEGVYTQNDVLFMAAWNDVAEYRKCEDVIPGTCVVESDKGLVMSSKKGQKVPHIVSDTYGMCLGADECDAKPIAIAGRVLAYADSKLKIGDIVGSGKNGSVSKMSRLKAVLHPECILGYVIGYEENDTWNDRVEVNNRVWIMVK